MNQYGVTHFTLKDNMSKITHTSNSGVFCSHFSDTQTCSTADNGAFPRVCETAANDDESFSIFKQDPVFTSILEHVAPDLGLKYYEWFSLNKKIIKLLDKFKANDRFGSPTIIDYEFGSISPSTLRYIKILSDLSQINLENKDIVEIGGGYGGQYTVLRQYAKPKSYTFIDLPEVLKLQERYVKENNLDDITLNFDDSETLPTMKPDLVISNYAFSECNAEIQDIYLARIIKNSKRGYILHNSYRGYDVDSFINHTGKNVKKYKERPQTCSAGNTVLLTW